MAWQDTIISIVRVMINDTDPDNYKYSDERIQHVAATAATYVQFDVVLDHAYQVDVVNDVISPDPTLDNDSVFISLLSLKTACIIDQSNFRTKAAMEGIRASLGPAQIAMAGSLSGWKEILEHGPCKLYNDFVEHWDVSNASAVRAILSPFVGNKFDPFMLPYNEDRSRDLYS